ncbi:MAG: PilN domain-containing protein, partial [Deltaproteobacteria bacterium]|nr:PilN domain-containing protein [Deltaproteobacteria bacterium]
RRRDAGERALVIMGAAVLAAVGFLAVVTTRADSELQRLVRANNVIKDDIERMKTELGDYDAIKQQRADLLKQQKTIDALKTGRTGPVYLMRELSEILTTGKGPTFDRVSYEERLRRDPNVGFNAGWDPRRVWLETFDEVQRKVRIQASARTNEDVAEFLKRLQLSVFFAEVTPESTTQVTDSVGAGGAKRVAFKLSARVVY